MNTSLSISCERAPQPASDPLEELTSSAIRIYAGRRCVTRWLDRQSREEIDTLYVPAFPLACWIVTNWWSLLNEPSLEEFPPSPRANWTHAEFAWLQRHCLRSADCGLFLPRLCIWNDGKSLSSNWTADPDDDYSTMPGQFLYGSSTLLDATDAEDALRAFVTTVLRWIENSKEDRAETLRANWRAIIDANPDESAFCKAAGRMGLDPYRIESWPTGLADLLERISDQKASAYVADFLAATTPQDAIASWNWVESARKAGQLDSSSVIPKFTLNVGSFAGQAGVDAARALRSEAGLSESAPMQRIDSFLESLGFGTIRFEEFNHQPSPSIRAAVGWQAGGDAAVLGPKPRSAKSERFLLARGVFHSVFACGSGVRLITRSHDWDQQASRGFAAELLAPRAALASEIPTDLDDDERAERISEISEKYQVDSELVRRQLQNAAKFGN